MYCTVLGQGRGTKRSRDAANSSHVTELKRLVKHDLVRFKPTDVDDCNIQGSVVLVDRFNQTIDVEVDSEILTIAVHQLRKTEGMCIHAYNFLLKNKIQAIHISSPEPLGS